MPFSAVSSLGEGFSYCIKISRNIEPAMGVGNFFGIMPEEMRKESRLHGVELDSITGRIAKQLYQTADIQIKGYEETTFSDNYFDAAIGNVPFGNYGVSTSGTTRRIS